VSYAKFDLLITEDAPFGRRGGHRH